MSFKLSLLSCLCFPIWEVESHSYLAFPASRNLLANLAGQETCPHCLQSGGPDNVKERGAGVWPTRLAPGSHGLCGDPVQGKSNPMRLADETYLRAGEVTMTYAPGQVAEFQIAVSTHHQGHYEFRICDEPLDGRSLTSAAEGQACLDQWLLERAAPLEDCEVNDARGDCQPLDPKHPERWYLPPPGSQTQVAGRDFNDSMAAPSYPSSGEVHRMRFKIPEGLRCTKCTLQWYWSSGNSCYYDGDYFDYYRGIAALGWDAAAWQPQILASWANCENSCCKTGGSFGEEFWNCADIAVLPSDGSSPSTSSSSASASTTASATASTTAAQSTTVSVGTTSQSTVPSTSTASPTTCSKVWAPCGGRNWDGPTCCEEGLECFVESVWYAQCRPPAALTEVPDLATGPAKKRRFRGSSFLQDGVIVDQADVEDEL
mmetsp:Transcript_8241/g.14435  ORF Transcript_8241/g.14435 Transcript_8241/m.14435 type:complete len:430 (+) Transcript_8241:40-1329(+)